MSAGPSRGLRRAGLGTGGTRTLYVLGVLSGIKALALVLLADSLARGIVGVINGDEAWRTSLLVAVAAAVLRAVAHWATQTFAAREVLGIKEKTRQELAERLVSGGVGSVGAMTTLATQGLDELDKYYGTVLPATTGAAVIPLVIGARILAADWLSALIIVLTVPLIPIFMALIGIDTQEKVAAASAALGRLSDHLVELARGLPVLVGLGRVDEQTAALEHISDDYRVRTMQTLRSAFMSSLALELISTISVAVVAVFIGTRLVADELPLEVGLLVLILAPECFAPFRDLGAAFHASQDGVLALGRARAVIDAPEPAPFLEADSLDAPLPDAGADVTVDTLTVRYAGRTEPAVDEVSFVVPALGITALTGVSGSGKTTVLDVLGGRLRDGTDGAVVTGRVCGVNAASLAWVPQHPHTVGDTVRDELRLYAPHDAGARTGSGADARISELLDLLGLAGAADADPAQLSPGELRRVAFARALLRVDAGATLLMLDEPTAHLDAESSRVIERVIGELRGTVTILLASHEAAVTRLATHRVELGGDAGVRALQRDRAAAGAAVFGADAAAPAAALSRDGVGVVAASARPLDSTTSTGKEPAGGRGPRLFWHIVRPSAPQFALAIALGVLAALFAISLTAVSGWLIVRASTHPPIMLLLVAIVGVRFFGIGRSVLHYAERLQTHDAIFASVTRLRMRIWRSLAARGPSSRKLLRGGTALDYLVVTADQVRDLAPRVMLPPAVGAVCGAIALVAVALLHAPAVPLLAASLLVCLLVAPALALWGDRRATRGQQLIRSQVTRRFAALLAAADDVRINGVDRVVRDDLRAFDRSAGVHARRSAWALGLGGAVVTGVCCATAGLMLAVSAPAVAAGTLPIEVVAVLVLLPLGLLEPLLSVVDAVQQWPALAQAVRRLEPFGGASLTPASAPSGSAGDLRAGARAKSEIALAEVDGVIHEVILSDVAARWPDGEASVFTGASASVGTGEWLIVAGPSGSGKSTLLTVLLGYLRPSEGRYLVGRQDTVTVSTESLRRHIAWCPQEGHLFDSTLRANLLLARSRGDAPDDAEMLEALRRVGLRPFFDTLPDGFDTRVGSEGAAFSGGQRQRVAVARTLLTRAEVVLLDEPTAHLDGGAAAHLMSDLRTALGDQVAVLVTHHVDDLRADDIVLRLQHEVEQASRHA